MLSRHVYPQRGRFFLLATLLLGNIALQIANPQIMRGFIDAALGGEAMQRLALSALAFIGIAVLQQAIAVSATYLGESVAWTATNALRSELARHCLRLDLGFHSQHTPGELIERIDGDVSELARFFSQFVVIVIGNTLLMVGILIALFREEWRAGVVFSAFAFLALFALGRVRNLAMAHQKERRQAEADLFGFIEEQLSGMEDIRSSGAVGFSLRELYRLQAQILKHNRRASFKEWIINLVIGGMIILGNLLAVTSGYFLYTGGAITIGTIYLFIHYMNLLETPLWTLTHEVQSFQLIGACVERLSDLRQVQPVVKESAQALEDHFLFYPVFPHPSQGGGAPQPLALEFDRVTFQYAQEDSRLSPGTLGAIQVDGNGRKNGVRELTLQEVSFRLEAGKVMGLLGRTGSGKTTLARLVFRLFDPCQGSIRLDGKDLREIGLRSLRGRVAMVTQDVQLFQASVRDNLTFFDRSIPDEQIWSALEELELSGWVRGLPEGLDTRLASGGRSLSAGEGQLLAFTRVFLHNPGLVILDEASSRLDPATENRIERAVDRLLHGRTAIVIAHRLHTVQRADEILILEDGQVCEWGDRRLLAGDPASRFSRLLRTGLEEVLV